MCKSFIAVQTFFFCRQWVDHTSSGNTFPATVNEKSHEFALNMLFFVLIMDILMFFARFSLRF